MALADTASAVVHLVFAGLWTGSVAFVTVGVLPLAHRGEMNAAPLAFVAGRLKTVTRVSALLLFATGGHLAGTRYTVGSLTGSPRGHLVLTMLALWFLLAALVEIGAKRLSEGANEEKVREPARRARLPMQAATITAILLLVVGGLLSGGLAGLGIA